MRFSIRSLLISITLIAIMAAAIDRYLSQPIHAACTLNGDVSMAPFLEPRVYFPADLNAYRKQDPRRWDAVVFDLKPIASCSALWVVGLPGETVSFSDGKVVVNGQPVKFPERFEEVPRFELPSEIPLKHPYVVPEDAYYLLGSNALVAVDSRHFGAVDRSRIAGRVSR